MVIVFELLFVLGKFYELDILVKFDGLFGSVWLLLRLVVFMIYVVRLL